jgi:ABC-type dipeptide/oligopeptide/nickel transport system ATPase component
MARLIPILLLALALLSAEEKADLTVVNRIKSEAFYNSQVMDHLFYLADVYGPRLTSSPGHKAAADWVVKRLQSYGLKNVKLEKWGPFGQSWNLKQFSAHLIEPQYQPLIGFPLAWTPGTGGAVSGEPVMAVLRSEADFEKHKGKLRGKVVLTMEPKVIAPVTEFRDVFGARMSTGMKQKVSIARALVHDPPVLIFDEPTSGLDVLLQRAVLQNIAALREQGKCILFSTHIMREVEKLCDRVAIMHKGKILAMGTLEDLRELHGEPDLEELFFRLVS